jgi:hypothetical protein
VEPEVPPTNTRTSNKGMGLPDAVAAELPAAVGETELVASAVGFPEGVGLPVVGGEGESGGE